MFMFRMIVVSGKVLMVCVLMLLVRGWLLLISFRVSSFFRVFLIFLVGNSVVILVIRVWVDWLLVCSWLRIFVVSWFSVKIELDGMWNSIWFWLIWILWRLCFIKLSIVFI